MKKPRYIVRSITGSPSLLGGAASYRLAKFCERRGPMDRKNLPPIYQGSRGAGEIAALNNWARQELKIPSGLRAGKPFELQGWQLKFLRAAWRPGVIESGLSVGRKNGKTGLLSVVLLAHLIGPLRRRDWRALVVSASKQLTAELADAIEATMEFSGYPGYAETRKKSSSCDSMIGPERSKIEFFTTSSRTGHSSSADVVVVDEAGLIGERHRGLWEAVLSSIAARKNGRLIAIGTRQHGPMFEELLSDPKKYCVSRLYSAPIGSKIDDPQAWRSANPGLGKIKSLTYMKAAAMRSMNRRRSQQEFRAMELNIRAGSSKEPLLSIEEWLRVAVENPKDLPPKAGGVVIGLDLGGSRSMSAAFFGWPASGRTESIGCFPTEPSLLERGRLDGCGSSYQLMQQRGELCQFGKNLTDVSAFLEEIRTRLEGQEVLALLTDRYRKAEMLEYGQKVKLRWPVVWRGQGAGRKADGSFDVRSLAYLVENSAIRHQRSLLVEQALAGSELRRDESGNPALARSDQNSRIDILSAMVMVAGHLRRLRTAPESGRYFVA